MKKRIGVLVTAAIAVVLGHPSQAQWDTKGGVPMSTVVGISRWGSVGIGRTDSYVPSYPLHIITTDNTGIKLVNSTGGPTAHIGIDFVCYNPGTSYDQRTARIGVIPHPNWNSSLAFYTRGSNTGGGNDVTERMRVNEDGKVGIGTGVPSRLLHLYGNSPYLFLDGPYSGGSMTPKIEFGANGSPVFQVKYDLYSYCRGGHLKIGFTDGNKKSMHMINEASGKVIFSNNALFAYGTCNQSTNPGLEGTYLFDDQVSSTSLLVAPATTVTPYPSIPSGYLFNVQGDSYLKGKTYQDGLQQINNAADLDPDKAISGITMGNSINTITANPPSVLGEVPYSWVQSQESRPLALNPIPNSNPGTTNTSYVAVGFIPGNYNVPVGYKLAVKGKIICEELKVKFAGQWSDYVFEKDYKLRGLNEVEKYIEENKHLPDVPSAAEIKEQGIEAGQMDATLLRKIEELTLYMIKQEKRIEELENQLKNKENK